MRHSHYYYFDMDGVLADFSAQPNAVARFDNESGFFKMLTPIKENITFVKQLIKAGASVRILSASPNEQADNDKKEWLKKWLPEVKSRNIILMRNGQNKSDFVKTKTNNILFDDYGKNCREWEEKGFTAYKVRGIINYNK